MKNLSLWAKKHKWQSWIIIAVSQMLLFYWAIYMSAILFLEGIVLPASVWYISLGAGIIAYFFYPIRNSKMTLLKNSYKTRKRLEGIVLIAGIFMTLTLFSQLTMVNDEEANTSITNPYARNVVLVPNTKKGGIKTRIKRWIKKRHSKRVDRLQKKSRQHNTPVKVMFSLLTLLVASLLIAFCIDLGCSLSCSGAVFLGNLLYFGAIVIGILAIVLLVKIWYKPKFFNKKAN
ncbi:MAG: hypothetical protein ACPGXZ_05205 [Saprospiraceae bacterium]